MEVESGTVDVFPVLVPVELLPLEEVPPLPLLELPPLVEVPPPPPLLEEVPPDLPVLLLPPPLLPPPPPPLRRSKRLEFERLVMNGMNIVESREGCDTGEKGGQETQTAFMSVSDKGGYECDRPLMGLNRSAGQINVKALHFAKYGSDPVR